MTSEGCETCGGTGEIDETLGHGKEGWYQCFSCHPWED